jgi:hypothetical protein
LRDAQAALVRGDKMTMRGLMFHDDGDWLAYRCGGTICVDAIEHDAFMQSHLDVLDRTMVTLVVRRKTCNSRQLNYVCLRFGGSYLSIVKWIAPISPGDHP